MSTSQNGWTVQPNTARFWPHPLVGPILAGPVWVVFNWFIAQYAALIEPIGKSSGCYNRRKIAGSSKWSNHASGTAIDLNWNLHPAGRGAYTGYTTKQRAAITKLLKSLPVLRWGGPAFNDPMHYEIAPKTSPAAVEKLATKLLQQQLKSLGYDLGAAGVDGVRGPKTRAALTALQAAADLEQDGVDGPQTWAAIMSRLTEETAA